MLCVVVDPVVPSAVYVGTSNNGVYRSRDGGSTWSRMSGLPTRFVGSLAIGGIDARTLYAGTASGVFSVDLMHASSH